MSGGNKQTQKTNESSTQTVQLPAWMTAAGQDLYTSAKKTADANPVQAYGAPITAGMSGNQQTAGQVAAQTGTGQGDLATARAMTGAAATGTVPTVNGGTFGAAEASQYMNPYLQQVQGRTLDEMARRNTMELAGVGDAAQASKAFGGTRHAVLEAETRKGQQANMLDYLASSNAAGYSDAQQQFERDRQARMGAESTNASNKQSMLDRMLAAGGQAASIGGAASGLKSDDVNRLLATGGVEQGTDDAALRAAYQEFLRMQDAPMERYRDLTAILSGQPRNVTTSGTASGTTTQQTQGSMLNNLLGIAQIGASIFSDRRLKRDIMLIEHAPSGLGIYRYNYVWDDEDEPERIGVMADEVERLQPSALGPRVHGFLTVDYSKLSGVLPC